MRDFAEAVIRLSGSKSELVYGPARPDDPRRRCPDITRARQLLGWSPKVDLDEGLRATLDSFMSASGLRPSAPAK